LDGIHGAETVGVWRWNFAFNGDVRLQTHAQQRFRFVLDVLLQRFRFVVREWTRSGWIRRIGAREYLKYARFVQRFEFTFDERVVVYRRVRGGFEKLCADVKRGNASGGGAVFR